jgi:fibro-slime domain-containing protein
VRNRRSKRGATLLYVVVTGAGVATVLSGLTGFTAEVSRREGLNEEKAASVAALDGTQEITRMEVRSMAYGGIDVDGYDESVTTTTTSTSVDADVDRGALLPGVRGIAGFVGSTFQSLPTNTIVPSGYTLAASTDSIDAFVSGGLQSKRSEKKQKQLETLYGTLNGAVVATLGSDGLTYGYSRRTVIGVPWTPTLNSARLKGEYFYITGGTGGHEDSRVGAPTPAVASTGMVEPILGVRGFPVASEYARTNAMNHVKVGGFDPQTQEILWWQPGYAGKRTVVKESERIDTFPVSWSNQPVPGGTVANPRLRCIRWSGSFNLVRAGDIAAAAIEITTNGDTWVFVNGRLAMDIGGIKGLVTSRTIDRSALQTGVNRIDIFYASRRSNYYFGLKTNLTMKPEEPVKFSRDEKFDKGWANVSLGLSTMTGVTMSDAVGVTDSDTTDLGYNSPILGLAGVQYDAQTVHGSAGAKFRQIALTMILHSSAWGTPTKDIVKIYQKDSLLDPWREATWKYTNHLTQGSYRRVTLTTNAGQLSERYVLVLVSRTLVNLSASGTYRIADTSFVTSASGGAPHLFLPDYEELGSDYAIVADGNVDVQESLNLTGSVWGGGDLKLKSGSTTSISLNLMLKGRVTGTGATLTVSGNTATASSPPQFVTNASAYQSRANLTSADATFSRLDPPGVDATVNLYNEGDLTLNNLVIPTGGTIYVKGNLTINGRITLDPGKELFVVVEGDTFIKGDGPAAARVDLGTLHLVTLGNIEVSGPIRQKGSWRTNGNVKVDKPVILIYQSTLVMPPGLNAVAR